MKIIDHIKNAKKTLFSLEVLPPKKGQTIESLFNHIDPLMAFNPAFIDVTYHREEFGYKQLPNGDLRRYTTKKRPGTVGICAAIQNKYKVDAVPHMICGGFTAEETENALIDLDFLGIDNILALRGDPIKTETSFVPQEDGHQYASDLIKQIVNQNNGQYLHEEIKNAHNTDFCIGVAGYPEKHFEAPSFSIDLKYLKMKVDMGAQYIITQMFYDNKKYFDFVDLCKKNNITVPIIPGLKPITAKRQLNVLPATFHIDLPDDLAVAVFDAKTKEDITKIGIEWCVQQSKELMNMGVPVLHYYSMGQSKAVLEIAKQLF